LYIKIHKAIVLSAVSLCVRNLVCHTEVRTDIEGIMDRVLRRIFGLKKEEVTEGW
jgi:hypothetical protein